MMKTFKRKDHTDFSFQIKKMMILLVVLYKLECLLLGAKTELYQVIINLRVSLDQVKR